MADFASMSLEERRAALRAASLALAGAAATLRPHLPLFEQFAREQRDMENFGHILDPTLYRDPERRETSAAIGPLYQAAQSYLEVFDAQIAAILEQAGQGPS